LIFPSRDVPALRNHLFSLVSDPAKRKALSVAARQRAELFAWPAIASRYLDAFSRIQKVR
jgi:glycosyltransferase involved in cell wall biosynthesis